MEFIKLEVDSKRYEIQELVMMEEHLKHNFIPPYPIKYAKYLVGMIKKVNEGEINFDDEVIINVKTGERKTINDIIEKFHLEQMIDENVWGEDT